MTKPEFIPWTDEEWAIWFEGDEKKILGELSVEKEPNYILVRSPKWRWSLPLFHGKYTERFIAFLWICHFSPQTLYKLYRDKPGECCTFRSWSTTQRFGT